MSGFNFIGGSYRARSYNFDASRTVNLYPEVSGTGTSKTPAMLIGTPGRKLFASLPDYPCRGSINIDNTTSIAVMGASVFTVKIDGTYKKIGNIVRASTLVSMASNGQEIMMVTGKNGYSISLLDVKTTDQTGKVTTVPKYTLTPIINSAFVGGDTVGFFDGYFMFNMPGTQEFQITGLYSETIAPLDFASAEGSPDLLISLIIDHREAWLFGQYSTEVFYDSGNADFPFERIQGAFIEQGCAAPHSVAKMDNTVFWLTADERGQGTVQKAVGYTPQRISDHALEFAIQGYSRIDDAEAYTYQQEGHSFYVLTFPSGNATWVFDAATNLWHQRAYRDPNTGSLGRERSRTHMVFNGLHIVGDYQTGNLYQLDLNTYTDGGDIMPAIRQFPHMSDSKGRWQFFQSLWIDMEVGVGGVVVEKILPYQGWLSNDNTGAVLSNTSSAQYHSNDGSPGTSKSTVDYPALILEWSDDGGHSFAEHARLKVSMGKIGERKARAKFRRLGKSRDRVWRVIVTDPVKRVFIGGDVEMRTGAN